MSYLAAELLQCETRSKLLHSLLVERRCGSVSEMARRCRLSPRAVGREVEHLEALSLVSVTGMGANLQVEADWNHPACGLLAQLFTLAPTQQAEDAGRLRASMAAYGAPLVGVEPSAHFSFEETLIKGLAAARQDGTILRVLPVLLAKHHREVDWVALKEEARRARLKAELGLLLDLTGRVLGDPSLHKQAEDLKDRRRTRMHYYPEVKNRFEKQLAEAATPSVAREWGFFMNMSEDSVHSTLSKHCPELSLA